MSFLDRSQVLAGLALPCKVQATRTHEHFHVVRVLLHLYLCPHSTAKVT